jgi:hypothetical protein
MKIKMPFNKWSKDRLESGDKFATSRTKKYGKTGDYFLIGSHRYEIQFVVKLPLWFIRAWLYKTEGAETMDEFVEVWKKIHPVKGWDDNQIVWYHCFIPVMVNGGE